MSKFIGKLQSAALLFLTIIMTVLFTGCSKSIQFDVLDFNPNVRNDYSNGTAMNFVNCVRSKEELEKLYDTDYFGEIDLTPFAKFDDSYFQDNALLILCIAGDKNNVISVQDIFILNNELFVSVSSSAIKELTMYHYKYICLPQNTLKNVTKFSYIYKTTNKARLN